MPFFAYKAADRRGQTIDGVMEAADARSVVEQLQRDAYFPIQVAPQREHAGVGRLARARLGAPGIRGRDLVAFTQQLATLIEAGLPLDRALGIQEGLTASPRLRAIIGDVLKNVRAGTSLGEALAKHHPRPFSRLYVNMVRAGERGGVLEQTLRRLAEFLEEAQEFRDALLSALIYPTLVAAVGGAAVIFLLTFVVPRFADIFRDLGSTIPAPTQALLTTSAWIRAHWWALAGAVLAFVLALRMWVATPRGRLEADRMLLRVPIIGSVLLQTDVARFARITGTLLRSGVPMLPALGVVKDMLGNQVVGQAVDSLADGVRGGAGLAKPMVETGVFPALATHMVKVGEETGRLDEVLLKVGATYEADTRKSLKRLIALIEPGIILVMGLVVGFIVVAMLLAILSITDIPV
ncbi:MAG TPA: type II secretion system F family protein [Candidatus Bathyarchaeia archaeon]|nr:type II secretion system F family protein [Candidatus Bathyarchaeia archaeon]